MNNVGLKNFNALDLIDINICPHYNKFPKKYENCDEKIKNFSIANNIKITKIVDGEAIVIDTKTKKLKTIKGKVIEGR